MSDTPNPSAGWYENPEDATELRYWNGSGWTSMRRVRQTEPQLPPYGARVEPSHAETPLATGPLLAAGCLLILAGVGRAVSYFLPYEVFGAVLVASALEVVGWVGAFVAFLFAGYPARRASVRALTLTLVGLYAVGGLITLTIAANPYSPAGLFALVGLFGFVNFGVGIAFAIAALRSPALARRLRALPIALYLGLILFGLVAAVVSAAVSAGAPLPTGTGIVVAGLSGLVPITVGALFLAFGRAPKATPNSIA